MEESLENFVEFKVKDFKKINKKIICLTYLKETLKTNDTIFNNFIETYKNLLNEHKGCFVFIVLVKSRLNFYEKNFIENGFGTCKDGQFISLSIDF